jgi:hypothetical protein
MYPMSLAGVRAPNQMGAWEKLMPPPQKTPERCAKGWHDDPDNSGMCIRCGVILDPAVGEDPNEYRRSRGLPDVPVDPTDE